MEFKKADIEKILGFKRTKLQEWINFGLVKPFKGAPGQGVPNLLNEVDLYMMKFLEQAIFRGIPRKKAADMVAAFRRTFRKHKLNALPDFLIFCAKYNKESSYRTSAIKVLGPGKMADFNPKLAEKYDEVFIFNLKDLKEHVDKNLAEF